jgi:hypothetical protein
MQPIGDNMHTYKTTFVYIANDKQSYDVHIQQFTAESDAQAHIIVEDTMTDSPDWTSITLERVSQ